MELSPEEQKLVDDVKTASTRLRQRLEGEVNRKNDKPPDTTGPKKEVRLKKKGNISPKLAVYTQLGVTVAFFCLLYFTDIIYDFAKEYDFLKVSGDTAVGYELSPPNQIAGIVLKYILILTVPAGITAIVAGLDRLLFLGQRKGSYGGFRFLMLMNVIYVFYLTVSVFTLQNTDAMWPAVICMFIANTIVAGTFFVLFKRKQSALTVAAIAILVTSVGLYNGWLAFAFNRSVTIPVNVTVIADGEFAGKQLTVIELHDGVTSIGNKAFSRNGLTDVDIPAGVTSIGTKAFRRNRLTCITIGANVTLGSDAFGFGFEEFYRNNGMMAGKYTRSYTGSTQWTFTPPNTGNSGGNSSNASSLHRTNRYILTALSSIMKPEIISKNGASPKSHTSRGNFKNQTIMLWRDTSGSIVTRRVGNRLLDNSGNWLFEIRGDRIYDTSGNWRFELRGDRIYDTAGNWRFELRGERIYDTAGNWLGSGY